MPIGLLTTVIAANEGYHSPRGLVPLTCSKTIFMSNTGKILVALAAGAAIGMIGGILFAPDKGTETRKKIKEKGKKISGKLKGELLRQKEKINHLEERIRETVKDTAAQLS